jgi:hypothetical protein
MELVQQKLNIISVCKVEPENYKRPIYSKVWVDRLFKSVKRNLQIDFDFYCFSNDITSNNYTILPLTNNAWGWWNKLEMFKAKQFIGPCLFFDLDIVICKNITDIVQSLHSTSFYMVKEPYTNLMNSSIMFWNGDYDFIFTNYLYNKSYIENKYKKSTPENPMIGDSGYISEILNNKITDIQDAMPENFVNWKHHKIQTKIADPGILLFTGSEKPSNNLDIPCVHEHWID